MPLHKPNLTYAYDDDAQKIIIIDAETGEQVDSKDNHVQPLLLHFRNLGYSTALRKFTLWCARSCTGVLKPIHKKFFETAKRSIHGDGAEEELQPLYKNSEAQAVSVDTVQLQQTSPESRYFLVVRECVNPNAYEGARNAAAYHCLWAQLMNDTADEPSALREEVTDEAMPQDSIEQTEQAQIDYLLELLHERT